MAFKVVPAHSGKHRRVRPGRTIARLAGIAALTAGAAVGATAMAAPGSAQAAAVRPAAVTHALTAVAPEAPPAPATGLPAVSGSQTFVAVPVSADSGWTTPVGNAPIGTGYGVPGPMWSSGHHTGVDFLVGSGTPVHAVGAGTVVSAGPDGAYGNDVILHHADGEYTLYAHLTQPLVAAGQTVTAGQQIGISGATGNVTGPHLHFEVRTTPNYGSDIDPVAYLASHGVTI